MKRRNGHPARANGSQNGHKSVKAPYHKVMMDTVKECRDMPPEAAALAIQRMSLEALGYTDQRSLAIMSQDRYSAKQGNGDMPAIAARAKANGKPVRKLRRTSSPPVPTGGTWAERFARGVIRWRESAGLSVPKVSSQSGIPMPSWYKVERGTYPSATGLQADEICKFIGKDITEIIRTGDNP